MKLEHQRALIVFLWIGFSAQVGFAQGVPGLFDWTYQGRLMQDGSASDGLFDFEFKIFDAASEGNLVAGPETKEGVTVSGGLFAVALQFGPEVFRALEPRYLEIGVRVNGSGLPFTMLTPRQLISPAPAALVANEARGATGTFRIASGSPAEIILGNDNSVKIGRDTAANALTILSPGALHLVRPDAEGPRACSGSGDTCQTDDDCALGACNGRPSFGFCHTADDCPSTGDGSRMACLFGETCDPVGSVGGSLAFGPDDACSVGKDPNLSGLTIRDPLGVRMVITAPEGTCSESGTLCNTDEDCPAGLCFGSPMPCHTAFDCPRVVACEGGETCLRDEPGKILFGASDEISIGANVGRPGLTLRDPFGLLVGRSHGRRCQDSGEACETDTDCPSGGCSDGSGPCRTDADCDPAGTCSEPFPEACLTLADSNGQILFSSSGDGSFGFDSVVSSVSVISSGGLRVLRPYDLGPRACSISRTSCITDNDCPVGTCPGKRAGQPDRACHSKEDCRTRTQCEFPGLDSCLFYPCDGGETCDPILRVGTEIFFDIAGLMSFGADSSGSELQLRDPNGLRVLRSSESTCSVSGSSCQADADCTSGGCSGGVGSCQSDEDCNAGFTCTTPPPEVCGSAPDAPGKILFGLTNDCSIGGTEGGGLTLTDSGGVRIVDPNNPQNGSLLLGETDEVLIDVGVFADGGMRFVGTQFNFDQGFVGIGVDTPQSAIELPNVASSAGEGRARAWVELSSRRWKEDIRPIDDAMEKLSQLQGVYFRWKPEHGGNEDIGLIAEEVGRVFPEVVSWEKEGEVAAAVNYGRLVAVAIEAIKKQQQRISSLEDQNADLTARLSRLEAMVMGRGERWD